MQLLLLPFFPESPRYLLIQKKDEEAAKKGNEGSDGGGLQALPPSPGSTVPLLPSPTEAARLGLRGQGGGRDPAGG